MKAILEKLASALFEHPIIKRIIVGCAIVLPVAWLWWSLVNRLPEMNRTLAGERRQLSKLELYMNEKENGWSDEEVVKAKENLKRIKTKLIASYEDLAGWLEEVNGYASAEGYDADFKVEAIESVSEDVKGVSVAPIKVILKPKRRLSESKKGYISYLNLLRRIVERDFGIDLIEVNMKGDDKGVTQMEVLFNVLVGFDKQNVFEENIALNNTQLYCGKNVFCAGDKA